jgi:diguanylate cyclase (GGDEF)-like protein
MDEGRAVSAEWRSQETGMPDFFEATPMALWLEDYSALHAQFERWRAEGVTDLRAWLLQDRDRLRHCAGLIRILRVNRQALSLFGARSQPELMDRLAEVLRDDTFEGLAAELNQLWLGQGGFQSQTVNYALDGRRLDLSLKAVVLADEQRPWDRVLVAMEDVTPLQEARRRAQASERDAREFFQQAPVSLWVEDFSAIKRLFDELRGQDISDFRTFLDVHPDFIDRCLQEVRIIDVNDYTLTLFKAESRDQLIERMNDVFREESRASFAEQLIDLWHDRLFHQREVQNHTLEGDLLHIHLQLSVFQGHEDDWGLVLVSLTDITARKKAEAYLEYLGKHDVLTQLKNRSYFVDELGRLQRKRAPLVSFIALDLNNLKQANDEGGHAVGDDLLRRFGEVLNKAIDRPGQAARIGGDEFVVILPGYDETASRKVLDNIHSLIELNNQYYGGIPLSVSAGEATCRDPAALEQALKDADHALYEDKRRYYSTHERRQGSAGRAES